MNVIKILSCIAWNRGRKDSPAFSFLQNHKTLFGNLMKPFKGLTTYTPESNSSLLGRHKPPEAHYRVHESPKIWSKISQEAKG